MLENISDVNWGNLTHAYGSAKDIPQQIYKLTSKDEKIWWAFFGKLSNYILYRDKYIFEATSYTVPFLIELLKDNNTLNRENILELLAGISNGTSYKAVYQYPPIKNKIVLTEEAHQELEQEIEWSKKAKEAVYQGVPIYYQLLDDSDFSVREAAIYTLASVKWLDAEIRTKLRNRMLHETCSLIRTNLIIALGIQRDKHKQTVEFLNHCVNQNHEPLIQLAAAIALVHIQSGNVSNQTIRVLIDAIKDPDRVCAYDNLLFASIDIIHDISWLLCCLTKELATQSLPLLLEAFRKTQNALAAIELSRTILMITFHKQCIPTGTHFHMLTEEQQETLRCIAENEVAWKFSVNMAEVLRDFRLPSDYQNFCRFIKGK
ncbi:HEAT repeat domain-containing protein [Thermoflavimicrobium daqui]|uniref:HEAT repeat domain-containing protein n=1 Tax=Thermoflavimicrobium daqui TaxID=2137476 RepID=A0A364K3S9_9BACL|nr:HEAT repeat domain-containing protein [Thermoflavimicrobium daqui]RAL24034.1 hypothetical protein DL897_10035 [Thermoflavimicrobium daqui]